MEEEEEEEEEERKRNLRDEAAGHDDGGVLGVGDPLHGVHLEVEEGDEVDKVEEEKGKDEKKEKG